jgi:hypothetical protein
MATIEQRLQILEQAVANSRITPQLPALISIQGDEFINIWSPSQGRLVRYPYANVIASGSIDPSNDIVPVFKQVPDVDFSSDIPTQIASYINNETDFTKTGSQVIFYFVTRKIVNPASASGFDFQREFYLFAKAKGTYGTTSGNTVLSTELVKQTPNIDEIGSIQEINLNATSPYDIQTVVNSATAFTPIPSATILFNILVDGTTNEYYLYQGPTTQDMGTGGYTSVSGDYIDLQTANSDPNPVIQETGWNANFLSTVQSISLNTWTAIDFTGGIESQNGGLTLLNGAGEIMPLTLGDSIQTDIAFEFNVTAQNDFVLVRLNVDGTIYGQMSMPMLRSPGTDETVRASFNIPVGAELASNNGVWEVFCNKALDIKNKYVCATRVHKAV